MGPQRMRSCGPTQVAISERVSEKHTVFIRHCMAETWRRLWAERNFRMTF